MRRWLPWLMAICAVLSVPAFLLAQGYVVASIGVLDGSFFAPSITFTNATGRGFYNDTANSGIGVAIAQLPVARFTGGGLTVGSSTNPGIGMSSIKHGTCSVSAPSALNPAAPATAGQVPCTAASVATTDRVYVFNQSGLEPGLYIHSVQSAAGSITIRYFCSSTSACPSTAAQTYQWLAISP